MTNSPRIEPFAAEVARPDISVLIPTYEPSEFLLDAINSVLAQDLGRARMQIAVVDDGSKQSVPSALLKDIAPGRIEFYEGLTNLGLGGNWNRAIALARGRFIHILHQDDLVLPGFYTALLSGMSMSETIGMGFCRHAFIDASGNIDRVSHRERWRSGNLPQWLKRISEKQRIQCPAAVVRRDAYEALGGFRTDLRYALDWEMWVRIASRYDVWYDPTVLAHYRRHQGGETARLRAAGEIASDVVATIEVLSSSLPASKRVNWTSKTYRKLVKTHLRRASKLVEGQSQAMALEHLGSARHVVSRLPKSLATRWLQRQLRTLELKASRIAPQRDQ